MKRYYFVVLVMLAALSCSCMRNDVPETDKDSFLTYFIYPNSYANIVAGNMNETELKKELEKRTGVKIEFIHPYYEPNSEFVLMQASNNLPDIIEYTWKKYNGGAEKALEEGIILPLNDIIESYSPNLCSYINNNIHIKKDLMTDSGKYYAYPFIRESEYMKKYFGPVIRKDWLDSLSLGEPKTIAEWEAVLIKFRENYADAAPLSFTVSGLKSGFLTGAFDLTLGYYIDNGVVKFGPAELRYRDFIETLRRWYVSGLISPDFASLTTENITDNFLAGRVGAAPLTVGGDMGRILEADNIKIAALEYPTLALGNMSRFGQYDGIFCRAAISGSCRDVPAAARFLDYGYGKEGMLTYNFGIEGISYNMEEGKPRYANVITKNEVYPMPVIMANYIRGNLDGPFIQMSGYYDQYLTYPEQIYAVELWRRTPSETTALPDLMFVGNETDKVIAYKSSIESYAEDMTLQFILGVEPLENYHKFAEELERRKVKDSVAVYQTSYDRYIHRESE
ncbi:MAG: extracellular solute-binding protein [Firmicutes bacterium]|nr:extracellular solute-binding protein [Bacillota bacterium]